jgi:hypothetical protein
MVISVVVCILFNLNEKNQFFALFLCCSPSLCGCARSGCFSFGSCLMVLFFSSGRYVLHFLSPDLDCAARSVHRTRFPAWILAVETSLPCWSSSRGAQSWSPISFLWLRSFLRLAWIQCPFLCPILCRPQIFLVLLVIPGADLYL